MPPLASNAPTEHETSIENLIQAMTLPEKVSLLAGASMWLTVPIERLNIPAIKVSDGPNGARGSGGFIGGSVTSACFPVGIALAATWDVDLIQQVGRALGEEAHSKGAQLLLAPTVNIHRSPLSGRNFECYSEDPYLSARMAVAYIIGLQSQNVGATVKHFVCNDSEFERQSISSEVDERPLREIYLPPFKAAVQEAKTWAVMSSYNKINGTYASENAPLLRDILKKEWGFEGLVMSDWFGTYSTVDPVNNGLDLEMPGPTIWRDQRVLAAVEAGQIRPEAIDESVRRLLHTIKRSGAFDRAPDHSEQSQNRPEHRALIRTTAAESIVLLKNKGTVLPLDMSRVKTLAVIGPNAKTAQIMGGGSAQVNAPYAITPYDGIAAAVENRVQLGYELGCTNHKMLPRMDIGLVTPQHSEAKAPHGFTITYFNNFDLSGSPVFQSVITASEQLWLGTIAPGVQPQHFSARIAATFSPVVSGDHRFSLCSAGLSRFLLDGKVVLDDWTQHVSGSNFFGRGSDETIVSVNLKAGQTYQLAVEYSGQNATGLYGVRLGYLPPIAPDSLDRAAALAARSDVALVFVGSNGALESEGFDRSHIDLVGEQAALIERVAAANPNTIVVLQTGSPVAMPWLDKAAAVIQAWFPGQECGNAIADVLFGVVNPSGKLPQTFPQRLEDNPAYINYPGENGRVRYGEGIFVGYRYYEKKRISPLFPFGFGLSYTQFEYRNLSLSASAIAPNDKLTVTIEVTNTGQRAGKEVVQLYVRDVQASLSRPPKELKGFAKVTLAPGETKAVKLTLDWQALAYWDDRQKAWVAEAGEFEVLLGSSSEDIRARSTFSLIETALFSETPKT